MNQAKVSIIILNWNGLDDTIECLESLRKITYPNYEAIVMGNGSAKCYLRVHNSINASNWLQSKCDYLCVSS